MMDRKNMDIIRCMRNFVGVAESVSFTAAALQLNTTTGYVSRSIAELETHLQTRLLNRTTRRVALTEAGERYLERCYAILASISAAEAEAAEAQATPVGTLRVHAMSSLGQNYVVPAIAAYQARYPSVRVDLTLSQNEPDLIADGYDIALRVSPTLLPDSGYISRRLGTLCSVLCASRAYLDSKGVPETIEELSGHRCLQVAIPAFPSDKWILNSAAGEHEFELPLGQFKVNDADAMAVALQEGMGIGSLPILTVRSMLRSGTLVRVLPQYHLQPLNLFLLHASRRYMDAKIRTWNDFLRDWIAEALISDAAEFGGIPPYAGDPATFVGSQCVRETSGVVGNLSPLPVPGQ
jgi:DNA-binding transcriptional LysR family regulator